MPSVIFNHRNHKWRLDLITMIRVVKDFFIATGVAFPFRVNDVPSL